MVICDASGEGDGVFLHGVCYSQRRTYPDRHNEVCRMGRGSTVQDHVKSCGDSGEAVRVTIEGYSDAGEFSKA